MEKTDTYADRSNLDAVVAAGLERSEVFERLWAPIGQHLSELADIGTGDVVLDIGTGHGEPALLIAQTVGPEGRVVGTDFHAEILDVGRQRASEQGLTWVQFEAHDAQDLDFPEKTFDAVVSRLAFMYVADVPKALRSVLSVLKPGGRFSIAVCGPEDKNQSWWLLRTAVIEELGIEAPDPAPLGEISAFGLGDLDYLKRLYEEAGFVDVKVQSDDDYIWDFDSAEEMVEWHRYFLDASGLLDGQSDERKQDARDAGVRRAREAAGADGHVGLPNQVMYAVGTRPEN